jgi:hypothetical protein
MEHEEEIVDESVEEKTYQQAIEADHLMDKLYRLSLTPNSPVHYGSIETHKDEEPKDEDLPSFRIR